jgi:hypothetical protein
MVIFHDSKLILQHFRMRLCLKVELHGDFLLQRCESPIVSGLAYVIPGWASVTPGQASVTPGRLTPPAPHSGQGDAGQGAPSGIWIQDDLPYLADDERSQGAALMAID